QGLKQQETQSTPGTMTTGNWEFVLEGSASQNSYVEANIQNTGTAGTYNDHGGHSLSFTLDSSIYFADPAAGGGYQFGAPISNFTLNVDSRFNVNGVLNQNGAPSITFSGTIDAEGANMTGAFDDGSGHRAPFTASAVESLSGYYEYAPTSIIESIS